MPNNTNDKSIKETLSVIRKALEEENNQDNEDELILLNQLVNNDGTISSINNDNINKEEVNYLLNEKLSKFFDEHFENWLNKNLPKYIEKYFSNKQK